jgi:hypothetical protein
MSKCKFLEPEDVQGIVHEICHNPEMLARNKVPPSGSLPCMGIRCGLAVFDGPANNAKTGNKE